MDNTVSFKEWNSKWFFGICFALICLRNLERQK